MSKHALQRTLDRTGIGTLLATCGDEAKLGRAAGLFLAEPGALSLPPRKVLS